jgi:putative FmdB family regulatory protein
MPTYEYKCLDCNYIFEEFQKMTDAPLTKCPKCNGKLKRLIGAGMAPIFKGSGFYETDYKKTTTNNIGKTGNSKTTKTKETKAVKKTTGNNK